MDKSESRQYFRIKTVLPIEIRSISAEEFQNLKSSMQDDMTPYERIVHDPLSPDTKTANESYRNVDLYSYLLLLDRKLDVILDFLFQSKMGRNSYARNAEVEISGAGIKFNSEEPFEDSEYVELKIIIPSLSYMKVTALSQVVRSIPVILDGIRYFEVALKFLVINEYNRDLLIKYIFIKEREVVRREKDLSDIQGI